MGRRSRSRATSTISTRYHDCIAADDESLEDDPRGRQETWDDMLRLQADGIYPAAFAAIRSPVLMLHGAYDPHPGAMIRDSLAPFIARLEYHEWDAAVITRGASVTPATTSSPGCVRG